MADTLKFILDYPQDRVYPHGSSIAVLGEDWNGGIYQDTFLEAVTYTLMLRPMCFYPEWWTSNVGRYAKLGIGSGIEVKTPSKWTPATGGVEKFNGAGLYLQCDQPAGEWARTSSPLDLNRGVFLSTHIYAAGDDYPVLDAGWSNSDTPSATTAVVGFRIWSRGRIEVYRNGEFVAEGRVSCDLNNLLSFAVIPMRRRELVFVSSLNDDGFRVVFEDIDESETAPRITPDDTKFFIAATSTANIQAQFAPLVFPTSGYAHSKRYAFRAAPQVDTSPFNEWENTNFPNVTNAAVYGDDGFVVSSETGDPLTGITSIDIYEEDATTPFVPDGELQAALVRATLFGNTNYTSFLYGAVMEFRGETVQTDGSEEYDATEDVAKDPSPVLDLPDDPFSAAITLELIDPETIEETVPNLIDQSYRPAGLKLGDAFFFNGVMRRPRLQDAAVHLAQRLKVEAVTKLSLIEEFSFPDRLPLDGWVYCQPSDQQSAVRYILELIGIKPEDMELSAFNNEDGTPYRLGMVPHSRNQEWNYMIERGDTGRDAFNKILRVAADAVYGTHPSPTGTKFRFLKPSDLDTEPKFTFYRSIAEALEFNETLADEDAWRCVYRNFRQEVLDAEGNELQIVGIDPRTGNLICAYFVDSAMQDPTLPPSERPSGWSGTRKIIGYQDRQIRTMDDAIRLLESLIPIALNQNFICEWDSPDLPMYTEDDVLLPLWRTDMARLSKAYRGEDIDRHISAMSCAFLLETEAFCAREARFCGGTIAGRGGRTLEEIQDNVRARNASLGIRRLASPASLISAIGEIRRFER